MACLFEIELLSPPGRKTLFSESLPLLENRFLLSNCSLFTVEGSELAILGMLGKLPLRFVVTDSAPPLSDRDGRLPLLTVPCSKVLAPPELSLKARCRLLSTMEAAALWFSIDVNPPVLALSLSGLILLSSALVAPVIPPEVLIPLLVDSANLTFLAGSTTTTVLVAWSNR